METMVNISDDDESVELISKWKGQLNDLENFE